MVLKFFQKSKIFLSIFEHLKKNGCYESKIKIKDALNYFFSLETMFSKKSHTFIE